MVGGGETGESCQSRKPSQPFSSNHNSSESILHREIKGTCWGEVERLCCCNSGAEVLGYKWFLTVGLGDPATEKCKHRCQAFHPHYVNIPAARGRRRNPLELAAFFCHLEHKNWLHAWISTSSTKHRSPEQSWTMNKTSTCQLPLFSRRQSCHSPTCEWLFQKRTMRRGGDTPL